MRKRLLSLLTVFLVALSAHSVNVILSEGFENGMPAGWTQEKVTGTGSFNWEVEDAQAVSSTIPAPVGAAEGSYRVAMRNPSSLPKSCTQRLITPVMDCSGYLPRLTFAHAQPQRGGKFAVLKIYYRSSADSEWTLMTTYDSAIDDWQRDTMNLVAPNNTYQLAFESVVTTQGAGYGVVLDDISIQTTPQCTDVQGLGVVPMATSAELTIGDLSAVSFQVVVTTTAVTDWDTFDPQTAVFYDPNVLDLVLTVTGLQPQTNYYAYVRSACADLPSGYTNWISASFRTSIGFPFVEDFETETTIPQGWQRMAGSLSDAYAGTLPKTTTGGWTYSGNATVTGSSHIYCSTSTSTTYWMTLPAIDLTAVPTDTMINLEFYLALTNGSTSATAVSNKSGLNFYVLVSEDAGQSWTASNTTTWSATPGADYDINGVMETPSRYRVNLNRYKGQVVQIAFVNKSNSGSGYFHLDNVAVTSYDPQCGDAAKLTLLPDMNSVTANWQMYGKENAVIEIATDNTFNEKVDSATIITGTTYTFTNLTSNTTYFVRVKQDCPDASWVYASCRTVIGMPYTNPFQTTTFPSEWSRDNTGISLQQLLNGTPLALTSSGGWLMSAASTSFPNMGVRAYTNIWSNNVHNWMVSPAIKLTDTSTDPIRLSFMMALSKSSSSATAPVITDTDDVFAVLISQDGGATWLAADATIWDCDSTSSNLKYYDLTQVPQKMNIDLTQYRGQTIRVAFYGGSTTSGSDNYMMIGNLAISTFDANCGGVSGLQLNTTPSSVTATWNTTGYPNVNVQLSTSSTFATLVDTAVVSTGTIQFSNLMSNTQYYLRVRQQCSADDSDWAMKAFKTPVGLPFSDPLTNLNNWTKMSGKVTDAFLGNNPTSTSSGWSTGTSRHIEGISNDTHASYNLYSTSYNYWLVSTPINMNTENGDPIQLEFDFGITPYSSSSTTPNVTNQMLWVLVSTDNGDSWTRANSYLISAADSADYDINNCANKAVHFKLPLTQYSNQTVVLAFAANQYKADGDNYVHLANIDIHTIDANCQGLSAIRATNITGTSADIEWTAGGAQSLDLTIATDTAFSQVVFTGAVTATYSLTTLSPNTRYYVKARQTCDTESEWTKMMFKTLCAPQTPDALGVMAFDNEASADCWLTGFVTSGSNQQYSYAGWAQMEKFGGVMALAKQGVNSETTTYNDGAYAIVPELNIGNDTITRYQVIFDAATYASYATNVGRIQVGIVTSPDQLDTYEQLKTINLEYAADSSALTTYVVNFADYQGDYNDEYGKYIMFKSEAGADSLNYVLIDNVSVSLADGCPQLVEHDIASLRTDSALFRWENVSATSYEVMVSIYGGRADTVTTESIIFQATTAADSIWITGLTGNTRYYAYVRAICPDGTSRWSGAKGFRTECEAIRTFPWSENFEDMETGVIDVDCWDMFQYAAGTGSSGTSGSGFQISTTTMVGNSSKKLYLPDMKAGEMTQLTLPVMYGAAAPGQYELVIDVLRNGSGTKQEGLHIYASPDGTMAKAVEMAFIYRYYTMEDSVHHIPAESASGWYTYELTIPISGYFHIIIMGESQWGSATYADNIIIRQKAACPRPVFKPVSNITTTSIDVAWTGSTASTYEVEYSIDSEFSTIDGTQTVNNDSTATLTGLQPGTIYYFRVRGVCGSEDLSEWSRVISAQTAYSIPFIETFNLSALPSSWTIMTGTPASAFSGSAPSSSSGGWKIMTNSNGLPANHLAINIYSSTNNRWIVAPTLDLSTIQATDSLEFSFDFAYTNYNSASDIDANSDQSLWLLVSLDGGQTWDYQNSYVWTNSDTAAVTYSISSIPLTGTHIKLDFSRFAQQSVRFAFVATTVSGDNDFHIANVQLIKVLAGCETPSMVSVEPDTYTASVMWEGDSTKTTVIQLSTAGDFTKDVLYDTIPNGLSAVVSGLNHSSTYYVRVKQLCSATEETVWSSAMTFRTNCMPISTFPWTETFESTATSGYLIPSCWERIAYRSSSTIYPYVYNSTTYATSGSHVLYMYGGSSTTKQAIILPEVGESLNRLVLRCNYRTSYTTASYARLVLGTISDITDINTFTALDTLPLSTSMTEYEFYLNNVDSTARLLAFALLGGTSSQTVHIDDISLDYLPACYDIKTLRVTNITATTACARLIPTEAPQYEYLLADRAITPATLDSAAQTHVVLNTVAGDTLAITGLQDATTYYMYVRALCDDTTASAWSKAVKFTTECYPIATLPWNEGFESYEGGTYSTVMAGPTCWSTYSTGSVAPHVISSGSYYYTHGGSKALTFYGSGYNYAVMPKFEAPIGAMRMSFWMQVENASYGSLELGYITDEDANFDTYTTIATFASSAGSMAQRSVDLSNVPITASRLVFRWYYSSQYSCCIDDIQITERPSNETLLNVRVANVTRTSMDIAWTPRPDSTLCANYELVISKTALNNAALDTVPRLVITDTTGYHASLLDRDTPYFIYARTACDSVYGVWVSVGTRTLPMAGCGDAVLVAEGSATNSYLPFYGLYLDSDIFTQSIYPASMLTELLGRRISAIKYFVSSGGTDDSEDYGMTHVRVGVTTQTAVPAGYLNDPKVEVYSGAISATVADGMTITFNQPILYQGGNIFIEFDHEEAPDYNSTSFYGLNTSVSGCSRYEYNGGSENSSSFLPMIEVTTICNPDDLTPCPAIDGITSELQGDGTSEAIIRWATSNADYANGYDLFYTANDSLVPDSTTVPQFVNLTDTFVTINTLEAYTIYHVFVRVHCNAGGHDDGDSEWAEYVFQTLSTCPTVLNLNSVLTSKTSAEVTWAPAYEGQPADYRYIVSTTPLSDADLITTVPQTGTTLYLTLTGLTLDQQYWVYVASSCGDELSPYLMTTFTTPANCAPVENLTITSVRHNMVSFSWSRSQFGTETMWEVGILGDSTNVLQTSDTMAVLFGLREETAYSLYVKALCEDSEVSVPTVEMFTTGPAPLPCIQIGTGTTSGYTAPFNNFYENSWSQTIYTAEEIGRSGEIQSIWFHCSAADAYQETDMTIYLAHTSMSVAATTSDWIPEADLTQVFTAAPFDHPSDTGWYEIPLQATFNYNGSDNLAIVIGSHADAYSSDQKYYYTTVPSGTSLYRQSDGDATFGDYPAAGVTGTKGTARANTLFCFEAEACGRPAELTISDVEYYSARASWVPGSNERSWEIWLSDTPMSDTELDSVSATVVTSPMMVIDNLNDDVEYWFYVRGLCSETTKSNWSSAHFLTKATCLAPAAIGADSVSPYQAWLHIISMNAEPAMSYNVVYGPAATFDLDDATTYIAVQAGDTLVTINNLTGNTLYKMAVQEVCNATHTSRWSPISSFRTECAPLVGLPWAENFDNISSDIPDCWDNSLGNATYPWAYYATGQTGHCVRFNSYTNSNGQIGVLMSPELTIDTTANLVFSFKNPTGGNFRVAVTTDNGVTNTTLLNSLTSTSVWSEREVSLSAYVGQVIRIYFEGTSNYGNGDAYIYLDDVSVVIPSPCQRPEDVSAEAVNNTIVVTWTGSGVPDSDYMIEYSTTSAFAAGEVDTVYVHDTTSLTLTNLPSARTYYFRVRAICGEYGESRISGIANATLGMWMPYIQDTTFTSIPADWKRSTTTMTDAFNNVQLVDATTGWIYAASNAVMHGSHFKVNIYGTSCHYWLRMPALPITAEANQGAVLTFDLALNKYGASNIGVAPTETGADDIFLVAISTDGGKHFTRETATIWQDAPGADYGYAAIPAATVATYRVDLSAYIGQTIVVGFYGESTVSGGDNDLHLGNIRVEALPAQRYEAAICEGNTFNGYGFTITPAQYHLGMNAYSRYTPATESTEELYEVLMLEVRGLTYDTLRATVCEGDAYVYDEHIYLEEGDVAVGEQEFLFTLTSPLGCDSMVLLIVNGLPAMKTTEYASTCSGIPYNWHGQDYYIGGTYIDTLQTYEGCDSICTLLLSVEDVIRRDTAATLCYGEQLVINGQVITTSGVYTEIIDNPEGCDEEIIWTVTAVGKLETHTRVVACKGTTYNDELIHGLTQDFHGNTTTTSKVSGCDSTVIYDIWFAADGETLYVNVPENELPFVVNGVELISAGTAQGEYTRTVATECGNVTMVISVGQAVVRYTITVKAENGLAYGSGVYVAGEEVEISVRPFDGYQFKAWNDGNTENPRIVTATEDITYTGTCVIIGEGIEDVIRDMNEDEVLKLIENQQLIIIRNGVRYNAEGAVIE